MDVMKKGMIILTLLFSSITCYGQNLIDWNYQRPITLSSATPSDDFQVKVILDNTFDYTKTLTNGEDIRFYDANGLSLFYWIEEWNNAEISNFL